MSAPAGPPAPLPARPSPSSSSSEQPGGSETRSGVASATLDYRSDDDAQSTGAPRPASRGGDSTLDGSLNASNAPAPVDAGQALDAAARELRTLRVRPSRLPDDTEADSHDPLRWATAGRRAAGVAAPHRGRSPTEGAFGPGGPREVDPLPRVRPLPGFDPSSPLSSPLRLRPRRSDGSQDGGDGPQRSESSAAMGGLPPSPKKRRAEGGGDGTPPGGSAERRPPAGTATTPRDGAGGKGTREDGLAFEGGGESAGRAAGVVAAALDSFALSPAPQSPANGSPLVRVRASFSSATHSALAPRADVSASPSGALGAPVSIATFSPGACSVDRPSASPVPVSEPPTGQSVSLLSPAQVDGSSLSGRRATATAAAEAPATAPPAPQGVIEGRPAASRGGRSAGGSNVSWLERAFERIELNSDLLKSLDETESACGPGPGAQRAAVAAGGCDLGEAQSGGAWPAGQHVGSLDGFADAGAPGDRGAARTAGGSRGDAKPGRWIMPRGGSGDPVPPTVGRGGPGSLPSTADGGGLPWPRRSWSVALQRRGELPPGSPLLPRDPTLGSRLTAASLAVLRQRGDLDALVRTASRALVELWPQVERMARGDPLQAAGMATLALSLLAGDDDGDRGDDEDGDGAGMRRSFVTQDDQAAEAMARSVQRVVQRMLAELGGGAAEARCASSGSETVRASGMGEAGAIKAQGSEERGAESGTGPADGAADHAASAVDPDRSTPAVAPSPLPALQTAMERSSSRRVTSDCSWGPAASDAASAQDGGREGRFAAAAPPAHDSEREGGFIAASAPMQGGERRADLAVAAAPAPLDLSVVRSHASLTSTSRPSLGDMASGAEDDDGRAFRRRLSPLADSASGARSSETAGRGSTGSKSGDGPREVGAGTAARSAALGSATVRSTTPRDAEEVASVSLRGLRVHAPTPTVRSTGSADDLRLHPSTLDTPTSRPSGPGGRPASRSSLSGKLDAWSAIGSESREADTDGVENPRRPARARSARSPGASPLAMPRGSRDDLSLRGVLRGGSPDSSLRGVLRGGSPDSSLRGVLRGGSPDSSLRRRPPRDGSAQRASPLAPPRNSPASSPVPRASSPEGARLGTSGGSRPAFSLRALHDALVSRDLDPKGEVDEEEEEEEERRRGLWAEQSGESRVAVAGRAGERSEKAADVDTRGGAREVEDSGCGGDVVGGLEANRDAPPLDADSQARRDAEEVPRVGEGPAAPPAGALSSALASAVASPTRDLFDDFANADDGSKARTTVATAPVAFERARPELLANPSTAPDGIAAASPSSAPPGTKAQVAVDLSRATAVRHAAAVPLESAPKGSASIPIPASHVQALPLPVAAPRLPLEGASPPPLGSASPVKRARSPTRGSAERARPKRGVAERDQVEALPFGRVLSSRPGGSPARASFLGAGVPASPLREAGAPWRLVRGVEARTGASDDGASSPDAPASAKRRPLVFRSDEEGGSVSWSGTLPVGGSEADLREGSRDGRQAQVSSRRSFDALDRSALGARAAGRAALGILASPAFDSIVLDRHEGGESRRKGSDAEGGGGRAGRDEQIGRGDGGAARSGRAGGGAKERTRHDGGASGAPPPTLARCDGTVSAPASNLTPGGVPIPPHHVSGGATSSALARATSGEVEVVSSQRGAAPFANGRASANPFGFALALPPRGALSLSAPAFSPFAPSISSPSCAPPLDGEGSDEGHLALAAPVDPVSLPPTSPAVPPCGLHDPPLQQGALAAPPPSSLAPPPSSLAPPPSSLAPPPSSLAPPPSSLAPPPSSLAPPPSSLAPPSSSLAPPPSSLAPPRAQPSALSPSSFSAHASPPSPFPLSSALRTPASAARRRPRPESCEGTRGDRGKEDGGRGGVDEAGARGGRKEPRQHTVSFSPALARSWHGAEAATGSSRSAEDATGLGLSAANAAAGSTPTRRDPPSSSPLASPLLTPSVSGNFPSVGDKHAASSSSGAEGFKRARRDRGGRGDGPTTGGEAGETGGGRGDRAAAKRGRGSTGVGLASRPDLADSTAPGPLFAAQAGPERALPATPPRPEVSEEITLAPMGPDAFDPRLEPERGGRASSGESRGAQVGEGVAPASGLAARGTGEDRSAFPEATSRGGSETAYTTVTESWCSDLVCGDLSVHDVVSRYWPFLFEPPVGGADNERGGAEAAQGPAPGPSARRQSLPPAPTQPDSDPGGPSTNSILRGLPPSHARAVEAVVTAVERLTRRAAAERGIGAGPGVPPEGSGETQRRGEGGGREQRGADGGWSVQNLSSDGPTTLSDLEDPSRGLDVRPEGGDARPVRRSIIEPPGGRLARSASSSAPFLPLPPPDEAPAQAALSLDPDAVRDLVGLAAAMALDEVLRARAQTQPWARLGRSVRSGRASRSVAHEEASGGPRPGSSERTEASNAARSGGPAEPVAEAEAELSAASSRSLGESAKGAFSDPSHPEVSSVALRPRDARAIRSAAEPASSLANSHGRSRGSFEEAGAHPTDVPTGSVEIAGARHAGGAVGSVEHRLPAREPTLPPQLDRPLPAPSRSPPRRASASHDVSSPGDPGPSRIGALSESAFARVRGSPSPPSSPTGPPTRAGSSAERHPRSRLRQPLPPGRLARRSGRPRARFTGVAARDDDGEDGGDEREDGEDGEDGEDAGDLYALDAGTGSAEAGPGGELGGEGGAAASPTDRTGAHLSSPGSWGIEAGASGADGGAFGASRGGVRGVPLAQGAEGFSEAPGAMAVVTAAVAPTPAVVAWEVPSAPTTEIEDTEHDTSLSESRYRGRYLAPGRVLPRDAEPRAALPPRPPPGAAAQVALRSVAAPTRSTSSDSELRQASLPVGWSSAAFNLSSSPPAYAAAQTQHARARRARFAGHLAPSRAHAPTRSPPIPLRAPVAFPSSSSPSPRSFDGLSADLHSLPSLSILSAGLRSMGSLDVADASPVPDEAAIAHGGTRDDTAAAAPAPERTSHLPPTGRDALPAPSDSSPPPPLAPTRRRQRGYDGTRLGADSLSIQTASIALAPARVGSPRDALPRPASPVPLQGMPRVRHISPAPAGVPLASAAASPMHRPAYPPPSSASRPFSPPLASRFDAASPPPPHPAVPTPAPPRRARAASETDVRSSGASMPDLAGEGPEDDAEASNGESEEEEAGEGR